MANLDDYKALQKFLNDDPEIIKNMKYLTWNDYARDIFFELDGETYNVSEGWKDVIQRFDEDKPQYWWWKFDENDEYAIYIKGYYNSWEGSEIESGFEIGKQKEIIIKYVGFDRVK